MADPKQHEPKGDTNVVTYEFQGPADSLGRRFFTVIWWDEAHERWKAQVFHADPAPHIARSQARGRRVVQVEL